MLKWRKGKLGQKSKQWYDKDVEERIMHPGQLVVLHIPNEGKPLATDFHGPYEVLEKKGTVNYIISNSDFRNKSLLVHINMLRLQRYRSFVCNIVDNVFNTNHVIVSLFPIYRLVTYLRKIVNVMFISRMRLTSILHQSQIMIYLKNESQI